MKPALNDISIRTELRPGDLGYVIHLHGKLYKAEYGYEIAFEKYVAQGLLEFWEKYSPATNRVWVCEHEGRMIGFMLLMDRGESAQLRYFLLEADYRGIGLGKKLMTLYLNFMEQAGFKKSYLWTTHELPAAAHLYKDAGFVLTDEKESDSFGKPVVEQRYDLTLP